MFENCLLSPWVWDQFIREVRQAFTCSYPWEQTLVSLFGILYWKSRGNVWEEEGLLLFGISYFSSFCFSEMGEGRGVWENLACRRAGAVGSGLDVADESLIMIGVERNCLCLGDSGRLCGIAVITEGSWSCWAETQGGKKSSPSLLSMLGREGFAFRPCILMSHLSFFSFKNLSFSPPVKWLVNKS